MFRLDGRVAMVAGGSRGIGLAICEALANAGAAVFMTDVLDNSGSAAAEDLRAKGLDVAYHHHDVSREEEWIEAISACQRQFGGLDILVNNAAIFIGKPTAETTAEEFRKVQMVNNEGVFFGLKHAVPVISQRAHNWRGGGSIINLSSVAAVIGSPDAMAYSASKGAVRAMTKVAAVECGRKGLNVRVNSVHPGVIRTHMGQQVFDELGAAAGLESAALEAAMVAAHPIGRLGEPEDVAGAVVFLASDAAAFVTAAELLVDGGLVAD